MILTQNVRKGQNHFPRIYYLTVLCYDVHESNEPYEDDGVQMSQAIMRDGRTKHPRPGQSIETANT